jgi:hypothetical protein
VPSHADINLATEQSQFVAEHRRQQANQPLTNDRMLSMSRLVAEEDNLELLLNDDLIVHAR